MQPECHVLVFGSFDLLHRGHRYFLSEAAKRSTKLSVVLAGDQEILRAKSRKPARDFLERKQDLLASGLVDAVLPADEKHGDFLVLAMARPELIVLGDGQEDLARALEVFFHQQPQLRCPIEWVAPHRRSLHSSTRMHQLRKYSVYLLLLFAMIFWGSSWVLGKVVAGGALPAVFAGALRMNLLATVFLGLLLWRNSSLLISRQAFSKKWKEIFYIEKKYLVYAILSGLAIHLYNLCFFSGLRYTYSNQAGILTSIFVPLFSCLIHKVFCHKSISKQQILALGLGFCGGLILMGTASFLASFASHLSSSTNHGALETIKNYSSSLSLQLHPSKRLAMLFFMGTGLSWAFITLWSSKIQEKYDFHKYSFYLYFFASLSSAWAWLWFLGMDTLLQALLPMLLLVFLGSVLGTSFYFMSLRFLPANTVAGFLFFNPVCIAVLSWLLLKEPWTWELSVGGTLSLLSILLLGYRRKKAVRPMVNRSS